VAEQQHPGTGTDQAQQRHIHPNHSPSGPHAEKNQNNGEADTEQQIRKHRCQPAKSVTQHTEQIIQRSETEAAEQNRRRKGDLLGD